MALTLKHQTKVQYLKRLRDRYRAAEKMEACRLANKLLKHLESGDVTTAQMESAWNMTPAEWVTKAAALQIRADKWLAYKAAESQTDGIGVD